MELMELHDFREIQEKHGEDSGGFFGRLFGLSIQCELFSKDTRHTRLLLRDGGISYGRSWDDLFYLAEWDPEWGPFQEPRLKLDRESCLGRMSDFERIYIPIVLSFPFTTPLRTTLSFCSVLSNSHALYGCSFVELGDVKVDRKMVMIPAIPYRKK